MMYSDDPTGETHLFVDCSPLAEDSIASNETSNKRVQRPFFSTVGLLLKKNQKLV